jgi:hypothetical protein
MGLSLIPAPYPSPPGTSSCSGFAVSGIAIKLSGSVVSSLAKVSESPPLAPVTTVSITTACGRPFRTLVHALPFDLRRRTLPSKSTASLSGLIRLPKVTVTGAERANRKRNHYVRNPTKGFGVGAWRPKEAVFRRWAVLCSQGRSHTQVE